MQQQVEQFFNQKFSQADPGSETREKAMTCGAEMIMKKTYTAMGQLGIFLPVISHIYPSSI